MSYQLDGRGDIRQQDLQGETVLLVEDRSKGSVGLVDSTLHRGVLKLSYNSPILLRASIIDSEVVAMKHQRNHQVFMSARFIGCSFRGVYSGIDFGNRPEDLEMDYFGRVENCDFTQATLDGVRFVNTDISTLKLPRWPHVILPTPQQFAEALASIEWPGELADYLRISTSRPPMFTATVLHIPTMAKKHGFTVDEARASFEQLHGVLM